MTLDILCKVVDNYGDAGVVYRLARALSDIDPGVRLRIVVDGLDSFAALAPGLNPQADVQTYRGWTVLRWDHRWDGFVAEPPCLVLECFACGRPDFFEERLFDPARTERRVVVNVEHLSAEDWVDELHLMPSATRSALVEKFLFMPGFTPASGGLILDRDFIKAKRLWDAARSGGLDALAQARTDLAGRLGLLLEPGWAGLTWLSVFSYERDYRKMVAALAELSSRSPVLALVAPGRSARPFLDAWEAAGRPFPALPLPFLPQEDWDQLILAGDINIVRGEESLARAALAGRPFIWHAYLQDRGHHQVKVQALAERLAAFFEPADRATLVRCFLDFNERERDAPDQGGGEEMAAFLDLALGKRDAFSSFGLSLEQNGDLAAHLMTRLRKIM